MNRRTAEQTLHFMRLLLMALMLVGAAPRANAEQVSRTVCVLVDGVWWPDGFLVGLRRPFLQKELLVERQDKPGGQWHDVGTIPNGFRLAASSCVRGALADSLKVVSLGEATTNVPDKADLVVRIRMGNVRQVEDIEISSIPRLERRGVPPDPVEHARPPMGLTIYVATCAPESLSGTARPDWLPMTIWWRQNAKSPARFREIEGWMVGMGALQVLHRHLGLLPDSLDLVFESRGRNR